MKKIFFLLLFFLMVFIPASALEYVREYSSFPLFYNPGNEDSFSLWSDPAYIPDNTKIQFYFQNNIDLYTDISRLLDVLNGDYTLIMFYIDEFSSKGYGLGYDIDMGIVGKYWSMGFYTLLSAYEKGPVFPDASYGNFELFTTLYAKGVIPLHFTNFDLSIGLWVLPIYKLRIPLDTQLNTTLINNITYWQQDYISQLFKNISLYQGIGLETNSSILFQYKNWDISLIIENLFNTLIFYKKLQLDLVIDDPALLFSSIELPLDHAGLLLMDFSALCKYKIPISSEFISNMEAACGLCDFINSITGSWDYILDLFYLYYKIDFFSFLSIKTSLYKSSLFFNLFIDLPYFRIDLGFFSSLDNRIEHQGASEALTIKYNIHF